MKNIILLFCSAAMLICGVQTNAQRNVGKLDKLYMEYLNTSGATTKSYSEIEGSAYSDSTFVNSFAYLNNSDKPLAGKMRYNDYEDEIEFLNEKNGEILVLSNKNLIDSIQMGDKDYRFTIARLDGKSLFGFYELLADASCDLYYRNHIGFRPASKAVNSFEMDKPARFVKKGEDFYASFNNGPLLEIPNGKKKIIKFFRENGYVNNKISKVSNNREDLIEFVAGLEEK